MKDKESHEIDIYIGKRLREIREKNQLTQHRLGEVLGVELGAVSHYERGRRTLCIEMLIKLRDHFGIDPNELLPPRAKPRIRKED